MVETVNNLLQPQAQAAWRELSTSDQLRAATTLLDTVEQGAFVLADNLLKTDIVQENTENISKWNFYSTFFSLGCFCSQYTQPYNTFTIKSYNYHFCRVVFTRYNITNNTYLS